MLVVGEQPVFEKNCGHEISAVLLHEHDVFVVNVTAVFDGIDSGEDRVLDSERTVRMCSDLAAETVRGVDDGLHPNVIHDRIAHHQCAAHGMKRYVDEAAPGSLVLRIGNVNLIVAKIDEDSLARETFRPEDALGTAQSIGHNRQQRLIHG